MGIPVLTVLPVFPVFPVFPACRGTRGQQPERSGRAGAAPPGGCGGRRRRCRCRAGPVSPPPVSFPWPPLVPRCPGLWHQLAPPAQLPLTPSGVQRMEPRGPDTVPVTVPGPRRDPRPVTAQLTRPDRLARLRSALPAQGAARSLPRIWNLQSRAQFCHLETLII